MGTGGGNRIFSQADPNSQAVKDTQGRGGVVGAIIAGTKMAVRKKYGAGSMAMRQVQSRQAQSSPGSINTRSGVATVGDDYSGD